MPEPASPLLLLVLLVNFASTWAMAGLIWTMQWVHYPLFASVGPDAFARYQASHVARVTPLVGPLMLVELGTSAALLVVRPPAAPVPLVWAGLGCVLVAWIATAVFSVPAHHVLGAGFDAAAHERLVSTNWIRTLAWTAHAAIVTILVWKCLHPVREGA